MSTDLGSIYTKIEADTKDLEKTIAAVRLVGTEIKKADIDGNRGFASLRESVNNFDKSCNVNLGTLSSLALGIAAVGTAVAAGFTAIMVSAVKSASDLNETVNKFDTVFAGMADKATTWAKELQSSYGMSKAGSMDMLASLQVLNQGMGMTQGEAGKLSSDMIKLAVDLGSFNNLPTVDVLEAMRSAIVGEYDPIQRFAGAITAATVEQKAFSMGLAKTKDDLTAAAKAQAMYQLVLESNTKAVGDFIKTTDGLANQTKIFESHIDDLKAAFGERLMPVVADVMKKINEGLFGAADSADSLSEAISLGLLKSLLYTLETMRFFHNAWLGIKLVGVASIEAIAGSLKLLFDGLRKVFAPLDMIFDGLVKIGQIDVNPFDKIEGSLGDFAWSSRNVSEQVLSDIDKTNRGYDTIGSTIKGYIGVVKSSGEAHKAAAGVALSSTKTLNDGIQSGVKATGAVVKAEIDKEAKARKKLADEQKQEIEEINRLNQASWAKLQTYDNMYTSSQKQNLEKTKDAWQVNAEAKVQAEKKAGVAIEASMQATTSVVVEEWNRAMGSVQGYFVDLVMGAEFNFGDILNIFKRMLAEMLIAILASGIKDAFFAMINGGDMYGAFIGGVSRAAGFGGMGGGYGSGGISGPGATGWTNPDGSGWGGKAMGTLAVAGGAYGMYAGAQNIKKGNAGVGALQVGLGATSAYQGAVTLGLIEKGVFTGMMKAAGAKVGIAAVAPSVAPAAAPVVTSTAATAAAPASTAATTGGSMASGAIAAAPYAVAAVAAALAIKGIYDKSKRPSASAEIDEYGVTPDNIREFRDEWKSMDGSILQTVPTLQKYNQAMYDSETQILTLQNGHKQLQLQYDASARAGHQWSSELTGGTSILTSAAADIINSFAPLPASVEQVHEATNLAIDAFSSMTNGADSAGRSANQLNTYLLDLGMTEDEAAVAAQKLIDNVDASSLALSHFSVEADVFGNNANGASITAADLAARTDELNGTMSAAAKGAGALSGAVDSFSDNANGSTDPVYALSDSVSGLGDASATAAGAIAGSANQINQAWRSIESMSSENFDSHLVGGNSDYPDLKYHAAGGEFVRPTRIGSHVFGDVREALIPLPPGIKSLDDVIKKASQGGSGSQGPTTIIIEIAGQEVKRVLLPMVNEQVAAQTRRGQLGVRTVYATR